MATGLLTPSVQPKQTATITKPGLLQTQYKAPSTNVAGPQYQNTAKEETVENRLTGLLQKDNPYLANARASAERQSASRGLQNSSIAAGAGEAAAIQSALPIAQQDASFYQQKHIAGHQGEIDSHLSGQQAQQQAGLYGVQGDISSQLSRQGHQQDSAMSKQGFQQDSALSKQGHQQALTLSEKEHAQRLGLSEQEYRQNKALSHQDYQEQMVLSHRQRQHDTAMKQIDVEWNKIDLNARMQVEYDRLSEDNKKRYDTTVNQINQEYQKDNMEIMLNPNFKTDADRQAALKNLNDLTEKRMKLASSIAGVTLNWAPPVSPLKPPVAPLNPPAAPPAPTPQQAKQQGFLDSSGTLRGGYPVIPRMENY
jgi:hypothetical protein